VVHSKRKKEGKGGGWLGGAVCVLPKRERVECFGLGHSLNPPLLLHTKSIL